MEDQTRFNLETAMLAWRQDCASRPGISFDDARELESDLRERVADLVKQGLSEMEAFRAAVRQIGSPSELAREFARENPWSVWRERLFWMVLAGFAVLVWGLMTNGVLLWFVNNFRELIPLQSATFLSLAGHLPVLVVAVLLANGRFEKSLRRFQSCLQSRRRLALAGTGCLLVGALLRFLGPSPMQLQSSSLLTALFLFDFFSWPLTLLVLGILLLRPPSALKTPSMFSTTATAPVAIWRGRVFWMAVGWLMVGFWQTVSQFGITAMFYTGDANRPYDVKPLVLMSVYKLILLSPLLVPSFFLRQKLRSERAFTTGIPVQRRHLVALVPAMACAWVGFYFWSCYLWMPKGLLWPWSDFLRQYVTTFQWLWPVGLAALVLWLAPKGHERDQDFKPITT